MSVYTFSMIQGHLFGIDLVLHNSTVAILPFHLIFETSLLVILITDGGTILFNGH